MHGGEWLTRGTVWLALLLYVMSEVMAAVKRGQDPLAMTRWLNTLGCAAFLTHVACAFHFYHQWSHAAAYAETARQTADFSGWNWGGGLFINYLFALVWLGEVVWSWANPSAHVRRAKWMRWSVRGFFLFMMLNGAVVFVRGPIRWFGLLLCLVLVVFWWNNRRRIAEHVGPSKPA